MTTNEAAEPLRLILNRDLAPVAKAAALSYLDEALAAERRATVQRIRAAWKDSKQTESALLAILDEEAAR